MQGGVIIKKIIQFLTSLKFAIILFVLIALYSIIGTVLPQGQSSDFYLNNYKSISSIIVLFQLNDVYSSIIFRALNSLFILNLVGCTINILPGQIKRMNKDYYPKAIQHSDNLYTEGLDIQRFKGKLRKKKFSIFEKDSLYIASKHRIGNIGSFITHLGIVVIIIGAFFGNLIDKEGFTNLLPGNIKAFEDRGFSIRLDDFYLGFRDDGTTEQYYSDISIIEGNKEIRKDKIWVNNPIKYNGLNFYQSTYGWASKLQIDDKNGQVDTKLLRNGESYFYQPLHLTIYLHGYYPDLHIGDGGNPFSMTEMEKNPYYAVILYHYNENIASYVLEPNEAIEYEGVKFEFTDSTLYTGITYKTDGGYIFILIGSFLLLLGLVLSFYFYPKFILIEEGSIKVRVRQNYWGFTHMIKNYINEINKAEDFK